LVGRYYDPATGQFLNVDPDVAQTGQPYAYTGDDPVNGVDPLGLCTISGEGQLYAGPCATTGAEAIAAEQGIEAGSQRTGILGDIESGIRKYDPAYQAIESYDNEYHAEQDGCSLSTVFGFAAKAVVADVETGASIDGEGEVADAVDAADEGASGGLTRVGRWMSPSEYDAMAGSGTVQEGAGGVTSVADPADPEAYMQQAASGSTYAEFDVPSETLSAAGKAGWATIRGPNSWFAQYGLALSEMPSATNIEWIASKL
jgi:hypothetical protein